VLKLGKSTKSSSEKVVKDFEAKGYIRKGTEFYLRFKKRIKAYSLKHAINILLSTLGSNYKVKRAHIFIEEIKEIKNEQ
jgi:ribosomal protein L20A (L18A)